jgi:hypothetical protein
LEATNVIAAASGQLWTQSSYFKLVGGSFANVADVFLQANTYTSGGAYVTTPWFTPIAPKPTSAELATQRYTAGASLAGATTAFIAPFIKISTATSGLIDITLRIGLPQLEQGSGATSAMQTTNATVTRSADVIDLINQAIANNIRTLYLEFRSPAVGTRGVVSLSDNTANERASVITNGTDPRLVVVDGGVEQANINGGTVVANARTRVAVRIDINSFAISINGGPVATGTSGTLPTVDRLMIGRTQAGEYLNGPLARVIGWADPASDAILTALAT